MHLLINLIYLLYEYYWHVLVMIIPINFSFMLLLFILILILILILKYNRFIIFTFVHLLHFRLISIPCFITIWISFCFSYIFSITFVIDNDDDLLCFLFVVLSIMDTDLAIFNGDDPLLYDASHSPIIVQLRCFLW